MDVTEPEGRSGTANQSYQRGLCKTIILINFNQSKAIWEQIYRSIHTFIKRIHITTQKLEIMIKVITHKALGAVPEGREREGWL